MPYPFWSYACSPYSPSLVHPAKDIALGAFCYGRPFIDGSLDPFGNRHRSHMMAFSNEVSNHPVFLTNLGVLHTNGSGFCPAQSATEKCGKDRPVAFSS